MVQIAEKEKTYLIPIEDTDPEWVQTQEIPVIHTYKKPPGSSTTYVYLRFSLTPQPSSLDILAGDPGNVEIAGKRIKALMTHRLRLATAALQTPTPYPAASLEDEQIGQYFSPLY